MLHSFNAITNFHKIPLSIRSSEHTNLFVTNYISGRLLCSLKDITELSQIPFRIYRETPNLFVTNFSISSPQDKLLRLSIACGHEQQPSYQAKLLRAPLEQGKVSPGGARIPVYNAKNKYHYNPKTK